MVFPSFRRGDLARAADLNQLVALIRRLRVLPSSGVRVTETTQGTVLAVTSNPPRAGGSESNEHPFQLLRVTENETQKIRVRYGTINGEAPNGMSLGDEPTYRLTPSSSSGLIYAVVTFDRSQASAPVTSRNLGMAAELPEDTETAAHLEIGSWTTDEDNNLVLAQAVTASLFVDPYGFTFLWGNV